MNAHASPSDLALPIAPSLRVAILGTGFAGLGMAIRLREDGHERFTVYEAADDIGGTWRDNTYPGCGCDVPSHLYSYSFAQNPNWSRSFARQPEILDYMRECVARWNLTPHLRFGHACVGATWHEDRGEWELRFASGATATADVVVSGCGGLSRPTLPEIPGLDTFAGPSFHSARWDHTVALEGKRVVIVGTGASAIQIVPNIAARCGTLTVMQRTPPWIVPKADRAFPAAVQRLFARVPALQNLHRQQLYWVMEMLVFGFVHEPRLLSLMERFSRAHIRRQVRDDALRAKVTPQYALGCKRVLFANDYYPALQRPNVTLETRGITAVEPEGLRLADGSLLACDVLILATGFQAAEACAPFPIHGRDGRSLDDVWADAATAYRGTTVHGFPNLFLIIGPNTGLGHSSMIHMIESQVQYIRDALHQMSRSGWRSVDVRNDAQATYNASLQERLQRTVWASGCVSWYQNRRGINTTLWPGFTWQFRRMMRRFDPPAYEPQPR